MRVFHIQHFSIGDGPGIRTTIFFAGCGLRCPWCHNPEGLHTDAPERSLSDVLAEGLRDLPFYRQSGGGVTLSGGEPLCSLADCTQVARSFHERGIHVMLETALAVENISLRLLTPHVDQFLVDLKTPDETAFRRVCGGELRTVLANIDALLRLGAGVTFRVPLIPGFNMDDASVDGLIALLLRFDRPCATIPFHRMGSAKYRALGLPYAYENVPPPTLPETEAVRERMRRAGVQLVSA